MILISKARSALYYFKYLSLFQRLGLPKARREEISKGFIKKFLPPSPVVVDCGAYDGADTIALADILNAKVYAFEAVPEIYMALCKRARPKKNIYCFNMALSNVSGKQKFFVSGGKSDASSSLLQPKEHLNDHPETYFKNQIEVDAITLDDWAEKNNIQTVDLLWLDMQGFELKMLEASPRILSTVKAIHTEVSTKETYEGVELYSVYKAFLEANGFVAAVEAIPPGWDMGNVLFVRK